MLSTNVCCRVGNEGNRTRILAKTIAVSVKLGELYANPYVYDQQTAEARLVWAVETAIREKQRREKEGVKENEGQWMNDDEIGASLESMQYFERGYPCCKSIC